MRAPSNTIRGRAGNPAKSNPAPSGIAQGTPGGQSRRAAGLPAMPGDEKYLWALVLLEVGVLAYMRKHFKRHHGG